MAIVNTHPEQIAEVLKAMGAAKIRALAMTRTK